MIGLDFEFFSKIYVRRELGNYTAKPEIIVFLQGQCASSQTYGCFSFVDAPEPRAHNLWNFGSKLGLVPPPKPPCNFGGVPPPDLLRYWGRAAPRPAAIAGRTPCNCAPHEILSADGIVRRTDMISRRCIALQDWSKSFGLAIKCWSRANLHDFVYFT